MYADMTTPLRRRHPAPPATLSFLTVNVTVLVIVSIAQIIPRIMGQIWHVTFVSEAMARFYWSISPQRTLSTTFFWIGTRSQNRRAR